MPPASATINPLFARQPVIASVQWFFARDWTARLRLPFHWGEEYGVRLYRNFIVLTPSMRERIAGRVPGAACSVIPNGIEEELFDIAIRPGRSILYSGRLDLGQKGVDLLLMAYARLPSPRPPLVLAGHSQEPAAVEALARRLGVADEVVWYGRYDRAGRARLLAECRFVCVPSRDETFGMAITEACAAGKPVLHFDRAPMNEVAPAACVAVKPFDTDAFARAMQRLWDSTDDALVRRGEACRHAMGQYRWPSIAARQEAFYHDVLDRRASRAAAR
jgi:glycosyltransferase involved in cell wall biosynthesis